MRWSVALCTCNRTLDWDGDEVRRALALPGPPDLYDRLPRDEIHRFMDRLGAAGGGIDRVLVACCGPADLLREAAGTAGIDAARVHVVNLREPCFWVHPDPASARATAARLLRATMRAAQAPQPPTMPVRVGPTVLIATDSAAGLDLARWLEAVARPQVVLDERSGAFDASPLHPLPWSTNWGRVVAVDGALGAFRVTVEHGQPIDLRTCIHCQRCVPVCHVAAIGAGLRLRTDLCDRCGDCLVACEHVGAIRIPRDEREVITAGQVVIVTDDGVPPGVARTGYHLLRRPSAADVDALAWKVLGLVGEFRKPLYVRYDADVCAGGAAGHQACGRCIPACPYEAVARSPRNALRVQVDLGRCEGCGACVAVCPTSALAFTDPPPAELDGRLRALLTPLPETAGAPPVIVFHCPEEGAAALAEAGRRRRPGRPSVLPVPMACLRHVSEADVLTALSYGAAGVALLGCEACPHGARDLLLGRLEVARLVLDAFGVGGERVRLIAGAGVEMLDELDAFAGALGPPPVTWDGDGAPAPSGNRDAIAGAIRALIEATGREPGRVAVPPAAPFAFPDVRIGGCTLCRTCVNVCPTHAFRYREEAEALELRQVSCVNCGLCATACPESVITLRPETFLTRAALDYTVVVQDEALRCLKCGTAFGTRRAVEAIEAKVVGLPTVGDAFAGARRNLLRMCPRCRAAAAVIEMQRGWEP